MSSSTNACTCSFANIPSGGFFADRWPMVYRWPAFGEGEKVVVMQKTGKTTAVIHDEPLSTVYTYGPNRPVMDLHQAGDTISPFPSDEVAAVTAGIEHNSRTKMAVAQLLAMANRASEERNRTGGL